MAQDAFSAVITASRLLVPGSNTTNAPDSTLLNVGNGIYRWLSLQDYPRTSLLAPSLVIAVAASTTGRRLFGTTITTIARILSIRYEGASEILSTTDGRPLEYVDEATFELERQTFPGTDAPSARIAHWYRNPSGTWTIMIHPALDTSAAAYSAEVETEPADLASTASTVVLSPSLTAQFRVMLAYEIGRLLGREKPWLDNLAALSPDRAMMDRWLAQESSRGQLLDGGARRG